MFTSAWEEEIPYGSYHSWDINGLFSSECQRADRVCAAFGILQNNNLERALDWIFTHPEEEESDALSDMADTEPNDNAFSNANSHSDSTLSPDGDASGPRVKDGPGREWLCTTAAPTETYCCSALEFNLDIVSVHGPF